MYEIFILGGQINRGLHLFHFLCPATFQGNLAQTTALKIAFLWGVQIWLKWYDWEGTFFEGASRKPSKAVNGIPRIIPRTPSKASPQKETDAMITTGCKSVRSPIPLGSANSFPEPANRKVVHPHPKEYSSSHFPISSGLEVGYYQNRKNSQNRPQKGTIFKSPKNRPRAIPNFNPDRLNPIAYPTPIIKPIIN